MHSLSLSSTQNKPTRPYPSKIIRGLWRLVESSEPMVESNRELNSQPLWYESQDKFMGCVHYVAPTYFSNKTPVVVLLGPLLHPQNSLHKSQPWLFTLLEQGHPVYAISHRSHKSQSESSLLKSDCSFAAMVTEDILSAIEIINRHSGSPNFHLIAQGLGTLLGLQLMSLINVHRFESIHLFNVPSRFPNRLRTLLFSYMHQNTSIQQVWSKHLHTNTLPSLARQLSLAERSALLLSNSWLAKDWLHTIRQQGSIGSLSLLPNIQLLSSLPSQLACPVHLYKSSNSPNVLETPSHEMSLWNIHFHSLQPSIFPLITFSETLSLT